MADINGSQSVAGSSALRVTSQEIGDVWSTKKDENLSLFSPSPISSTHSRGITPTHANQMRGTIVPLRDRQTHPNQAAPAPTPAPYLDGAS